MTEFMHQPWGGEHRVYRHILDMPGGGVEEIDWCDACGTEVYHAVCFYDAARLVRYDGRIRKPDRKMTNAEVDHNASLD